MIEVKEFANKYKEHFDISMDDELKELMEKIEVDAVMTETSLYLDTTINNKFCYLDSVRNGLVGYYISFNVRGNAIYFYTGVYDTDRRILCRDLKEAFTMLHKSIRGESFS